LVVISNVQATVCDICGERVLDSGVLHHLSGLLAPERRRAPRSPRRP
jgi:hypothetical protein